MTDQTAPERAERFVSDLPEATNRTRDEQNRARLGVGVMLGGFGLTVLAVILSQMSENPLDQSTQISLGIAGLAAVGVGGVVFLRYSLGRLLRFWLLRLLHDHHERPPRS